MLLKKINGYPISTLFAFTLSISLVILTCNLNPDLVHDGQFIAIASGMYKGANLNGDIYTTYGPLTSWIVLSLFKLFGPLFILTRILGLIITLLTAFVLFKSLKQFLSKTSSMQVTTLYLAIDNSRVDASQTRWPNSGGIWPTPLLALLTLIALYILVTYQLKQNRDWRSHLYLSFLLGVLIPFIALTRIQGLVIAVTLLLIIIIKSKSYSESGLNPIGIASGFFFSVILVLFQLVNFGSILETIKQVYLGPFLLNNTMGIEIGPWMRGIFLACVSSILGLIVLTLTFAALSNFLTKIQLRAILFPALFFCFYFSNTYTFPESFSHDPKLWSLKVIGNAFSWPPILLFVGLLLISILYGATIIKNCAFLDKIAPSLQIKDSAIFVVLFLVISTNLYWSFSYVYVLFPLYILLTMTIQRMNRWKFPKIILDFRGLLSVFTAVFISVQVMGVTLNRDNYSGSLIGFQSTVESADLIEKQLSELKFELQFGKVDFGKCPIHFLRTLSDNSWKGTQDDTGFNSEKLDYYLAELPKRFSQTLICLPGQKDLESVKVYESRKDWNVKGFAIGFTRDKNVFLLERQNR